MDPYGELPPIKVPTRDEVIRYWAEAAFIPFGWEMELLRGVLQVLEGRLAEEIEHRRRAWADRLATKSGTPVAEADDDDLVYDDDAVSAWEDAQRHFPRLAFQGFLITIHAEFERSLEMLCQRLEDMGKPAPPVIIAKPESLKTEEDRRNEQLAHERLAAFEHGPRVRPVWTARGTFSTIAKFPPLPNPFDYPKLQVLSAWTEVRDAVAHRGGWIDGVPGGIGQRPTLTETQVRELAGLSIVNDSIEADRALCERMIADLTDFGKWLIA